MSARPQPGLANLVRVVHLCLVLIIGIGALTPWPVAWWVVLIGGVSVRLIWLFNGGHCPLTGLEENLRNPNQSAGGSSQAIQDEDNEPAFVAGLLSQLTGLSFSPRAAQIIVHGGLYVVIAIAALRLSG